MSGDATPTVVLLGPQRHEPDLRQALDQHVDPRGTVAVITAGWEEREAEVGELGAHVGRRVINLELHRRTEELFERDPDLHAALRARHDRLAQLQKLYRLRLRHLAPAVLKLLRRDGEDVDLLEIERTAAMDNLRALDEHHLRQVAAISAASGAAASIDHRPLLAQQREQIGGVLAGVDALCIAGGHVGILANRLWLFTVGALLPKRVPVFAWSAGAMAVSERIVLFHDHPPQGQGHAEVLAPGLGLAPGIVPLPDARNRLDLDDPVRVQMLARRFHGALCAALDRGSRLTWQGGAWTGTHARRLQGDGAVAALAAGGAL